MIHHHQQIHTRWGECHRQILRTTVVNYGVSKRSDNLDYLAITSISFLVHSNWFLMRGLILVSSFVCLLLNELENIIFFSTYSVSFSDKYKHLMHRSDWIAERTVCERHRKHENVFSIPTRDNLNNDLMWFSLLLLLCDAKFHQKSK